jgi:hypothetical protein
MLNGKYDIVALVAMRTKPFSLIKNSGLSYSIASKRNAVFFSHFVCGTAYAMTYFSPDSAALPL